MEQSTALSSSVLAKAFLAQEAARAAIGELGQH